LDRLNCNCGNGFAVHLRTRAAANQVAADLAYTRTLAVRDGWRARLVIDPAPDCPAPAPGVAGHRYRIVAGAGEAVVARRDLRAEGGRICLGSNRSREVVFNSRGLPIAQNRTLTVREAGFSADTLLLSAVGRVLRRY
jgi:Tfp pilus assembly protein FimT